MAWFGKLTFRMHCEIDKFCITCRKLITIIELQYQANLKANFNLNKFENLSIRFDWQSIISIQSFFNVMGSKRPSNHFQRSESFIYVKICFFCWIHKVDFCLANKNLQVSKWFATYPLPYICLAIWHQLFLKFWLLNTWFFAYPCDQSAVTRLENVRQLNIRRGKKLGFVIKCWVENVLGKRINCPIL